jgi:DNA polymerase I
MRWAGRTRIHAVRGQTRSATSRIYARSPAVQNIRRDLRHLFVPAPGYVLIKADYSQAQLRILAHLSGDPELVRVYNDPNWRVHMETSEWLGLNDRNVAKEINFAICFGMGPEALCKKINELKEKHGGPDMIDLDTAQSYIDGFYGRFPFVKEFFAQKWETLKKLPAPQTIVRSLMGRERRFPRRPSSEMERQFRVTWPQQIEADLIKRAMVRLDRIFRRRNIKARIVMVIRDALWVEAPHEEEKAVRQLMRRMMNTATRLRVPLEVDMKWTPSRLFGHEVAVYGRANRYASYRPVWQTKSVTSKKSSHQWEHLFKPDAKHKVRLERSLINAKSHITYQFG